jgi:hypothetical protein
VAFVGSSCTVFLKVKSLLSSLAVGAFFCAVG